jgi:S-adenosyl methyltransferase
MYWELATPSRRAPVTQFAPLPSCTRRTQGERSREPGPILAAAEWTIDFDRPVALLLIAILHLIQDSERPYEIVSGLLAALAPGSYLAVSHPARDILPGREEVQRRYNERVSTPQTLRTEPEVARFLTGLSWSRRVSSTCTPGGPIREIRCRRAGSRPTVASLASPEPGPDAGRAWPWLLVALVHAEAGVGGGLVATDRALDSWVRFDIEVSVAGTDRYDVVMQEALEPGQPKRTGQPKRIGPWIAEPDRRIPRELIGVIGHR